MAIIDRTINEAGRRVAQAEVVGLAAGRVRVEGKYFSRRGVRLRLRGVTYGPFAPDADGQQFPPRGRAADDFARMGDVGINAIRTYHVPPDWLFDLADDAGIGVFVDVPWPKHLCFLQDARAQADARRAVRQAAERGRRYTSTLAYSVGNEIPTDVIRWHGTRRVERFIADLADVARQADPDGLVTYASFPPTEYLDLSSLDFATFNVYLHDLETFRNYLFRLQNLVGDRPLVLGEIGMDTLRNGELEQARFLEGHLREATLVGLAGSFVFSWTDDWHTGGHPIHDWAFGVTDAARAPKASYHALREVYDKAPAALLPETPSVSVVVCTYNGGRTLEECLDSLRRLDYPDYEVVVVDDGSTDATRAILARFPEVVAIHQANLGLSVARNVGLQAARGDVVAYTDSDCVADPDWLTHLVAQLQASGAAAVGGPNLTPQDGWLAACVAASPGQPTHVLEGDQVAEHIPGCNMAFRREALEAINGFDPQYRKAGDDVDICWRLQHQGYWITYAPGAFVWHHRRQDPHAYLKQQAGYGEAEAMLRFTHPDKFNGRGDGKWRGVLYGAFLHGLRLGGPIIYRGTFGTGLFQCLYQPGTAHWTMLPSTLEWHLVAGLVGLAGLLWTPLLWLALAMLAPAPVLAVLLSIQARLAPKHAGVRARAVIAALCYTQPLVRSWSRYQTRLFSRRVPSPDPALVAVRRRLPWTGRWNVAYWGEDWQGRTQLLNQTTAMVAERGWGKIVDSGWFAWDLEVYCHPGLMLYVTTVEEDHGGGRRLIRVRYRLRPTLAMKALGAFGLLAPALALGTTPLGAAAVAALALGPFAHAWYRGREATAWVIALVDEAAGRIGLIRCGRRVEATAEDTPTPSRGVESEGAPSRRPEASDRGGDGLPADGVTLGPEPGMSAPTAGGLA